MCIRDRPVTPGFLIAVLLWKDFEARVRESNPEQKPGLMYDLAIDTLAVQQQHIAVPRRYSTFAREVWQLQPRLAERQARNVKRLLGHKRFRAAFDFLSLRGADDDKLRECADWWQSIQEVDSHEQQRMIEALPKGRGRRRRRRRKRSGERTASPADG